MFHHRSYAAKTPEKPAYILGETSTVVTYEELEAQVNRCAHYFRDIGLQKGDTIALIMENNPYFFIVCCAAQNIGLLFTPISTHLIPPEIEYILQDSGAQLLATSKKQSSLVAGLSTKETKLRHRVMVQGCINGYESFEETIAKYPPTPVDDEIEGSAMLYSSGTTGRPKGIVPNVEFNPLGVIPASGMAIIHLYQLDDSTVFLSPAPLYHAAPLGFSLATLRTGGTVVIMEKFDPVVALSLVDKYKVTHSQWVPTMFIRMLKVPEAERSAYDVSTLKYAIHAGAACPVEVKEEMINWWGPIFFEYYSASEACALVAITSEEWLAHKGSVGRPVLGEAHILDDDGNELGPNQTGTIYFANALPFEYHNDPEKDKACRNDKGWVTLGDMGYLDEEGYIYLEGRRVDLIISGGVNIYPQEVENVLVTHPKVKDAAVIGIPHEEFGEEVRGVVEPYSMQEAGSQLEQELIDFCRQNISKIKCPKRIDFVDDLPRTPTGKLLKRFLKERYSTG